MSNNEKLPHEFDGAERMQKSGLQFHLLTAHDMKCIQEIMIRASELTIDLGYGRGKMKFDYMTAEMDLNAVHSNGCPLDFFKFLNQNADDFFHDFVGIHKAIDRSTGKLTQGFVPKCAIGKPSYQ